MLIALFSFAPSDVASTYDGNPLSYMVGAPNLSIAQLVQNFLPCSGAVIGDSMAQWFTGGPYDVLRNLRMSLYGLVVGGPSGHYWHQVGSTMLIQAYPTACLSQLYDPMKLQHL